MPCSQHEYRRCVAFALEEEAVLNPGSQIQTAQFVEPTQQAFASPPLFQLVQINLQDNLLKSFLVSLFASGIRKTQPESLWPTYMISNQNMEYALYPID